MAFPVSLAGRRHRSKTPAATSQASLSGSPGFGQGGLVSGASQDNAGDISPVDTLGDRGAATSGDHAQPHIRIHGNPAGPGKLG